MTKRLLEDAMLDRRGTDREPSNGRGWWLRRVQPTEILAWLMLVGFALNVVGWRYYSPAKFDERLVKAEARVDTLTNTLDFVIYLQCVQLRTSDPRMVPARCGAYQQSPGRP